MRLGSSGSKFYRLFQRRLSALKVTKLQVDDPQCFLSRSVAWVYPNRLFKLHSRRFGVAVPLRNQTRIIMSIYGMRIDSQAALHLLFCRTHITFLELSD